jgi:hypothetical protein
MGYAFCTSACFGCGRISSHNPLHVPSIRVYGERQPICQACVDRINPRRIANGLDHHPSPRSLQPLPRGGAAMTLRKLIRRLSFAIAAMMIALTSAHAGDNSCNGEILPGGKMTDPWHEADDPDSFPSDCRFDPHSAIGKRILRVCPVGSVCEISLPLSGSGKSRNPIKHIEFIRRDKETELRKAQLEALPPELRAIHDQLYDDYKACGMKPRECEFSLNRYIQFRRKHNLIVP